MDSSIMQAVEGLSNEKGLTKETVFEAIQEGLESATAKGLIESGEALDCQVRVAIDSETGQYETFRRWLVVEDALFEDTGGEIKLSDAQKQYPDTQLGEWVEEPIESLEFSRIASNHAMPVVRRKIQEATRERVVEQFRPKLGMLVQGTVKKTTRDNIIVHLGDNAEALLPRENTIPHEILRIGERVRALLLEITEDTRGPQLILDRTGREMLRQLFQIEVPEIAEGIIDLQAVARIAGSRSKIAVSTKDHRIDPVGACVGMRGSRVQAVSNQLFTERIDVVLYHENPLQLVANAMSPAKVLSMSADEVNMSVDVAVSEDELSQAIGHRGENARLVEELTGLKVKIMTEEQLGEQQESDQNTLIQLFTSELGVDEGIANALADNQFYLLEDVSEVEQSELTSIPGFSEELAEEIQSRARVAVESKAALEAEASGENLAVIKGIDDALALQFKEAGIATLNNIASMDIFELQERCGELVSEKQAGSIIMAARAWQEQREQAQAKAAAEAEAAAAEAAAEAQAADQESISEDSDGIETGNEASG